MEVKRVFVDRQPGQLIQISLEEHVNSRMSARGLFSKGVVEVMVARVDKEKAKLIVTAPEHLQVIRKNSFFIDER
ncbi:hypothetical protein MNBD_GAMMA19-1975 [hydrothermal vent metagenome]|uniref:Uncharacterized protein n=1 Tax=hydrothermal vent metagenome TaxID=652676 RepID=A0A3B1AWZ4_9ZZZZ